MTVMTVQVDIGAALKDGFTTAFGQAGAAAVKLDNAISAVDTRITTMKGWAAAKKETAAAKEEWQGATAKAKALSDQLAATVTPTQALKDKVAAARQEADRAKAAFVGTATGLKAMDTQMKAAGVSIRTVKTELDAAERSMAALTRRKESLNKAMAAKAANDSALDAVKGKALGTLAVAGSMALPVREAIQFETAMADVRKAVEFDPNGPGLKGMELSIKDMARTIPIAHEGIAAIVAAGGRMGIAEKDLRTYTEVVAKMSTAWEMAPDAAGEAMGKIANMYGLAVTDLELVGDAINKLDDTSTAKASEIVDVLKRTGGIGKQFGLLPQQVAALGTSFLDLGSAPEVASTAINALLMKLQSAPVQTNKFQGALESLGWSAEDMQNAIGRDAQGTLIKFLDTVKGLDSNTRVNILGEMFGAEYADDMAKLVGGLDNYKKQLKLVGDQANYAGSMSEEFKKKAATTAAQIQLTGNSFNELGINIGTVLLPAVMDIAKGLAWASNGVASFAEAHPAMTKAVVFATAAFVTYKTVKLAAAFATLSLKGAAIATRIEINKTAAAATVASVRMRGFSVAGMVSGFRGARAAALAFAGRPLTAVLGGLRAVKLAVMTNPIGLIATGLLTVAELVITNWDKIYKVVKPAVEWISKVFEAIPVVGTAVSAVKDWLSDDDAATDGGDQPGAGDDLGAVNDNAVNDNAPAPIFERKTAKGGGGGGGPTYQISGPITIHVHSQPGQDPAAIAGETKKALEGATKGGNLYDSE